MLGAVHDEVLGREVHRNLRALAHDGVEQGLLEIHQERVAVLVVLELVRGVGADAAAEQLVLAHPGLLELVEDVAQRGLADPAHAAGRQLHAPALALDVARLLQDLIDAAQLVQRLPGVVAEQLLRQRAVDVVGPEAAALQLRLEPVHLLEPFHQAHRLAHVQWVVAEERIALAQFGRRHHRLHEARQPRQLEPQRIVLQERVHHLPQLLAGFGAEALQQRLHLRHLPLQVLEQLVEAVDPGRKHVAEFLHEAVEVGRAALHPVLEHLVQGAHHLAHSRQVLALHLLDAALEALEHLVEHLLLQLLHELLELLPCGVVDELVVAQGLDPAAEVLRHPVELVLPLPGDALHQLLRLRRRGLVLPALDARPLRVDDVLHVLAHLLDRGIEVVAAELALAGLTQLLEELLQAGHVRRAPAQQALQRGVEVAVVHQVVRERVEDVAGVEVVDALGAVPARVAELHAPKLAGCQPPNCFSIHEAAASAE